MDGWLDNDQLHTISDAIVTEHIDEILLLLITVRDGACGKNCSRISGGCLGQT